MADTLSTRDIEQRTAVLKVQISNAIRDVERARKAVEDPKRTSAERADARRFYDTRKRELADFKKQLADFEDQIKEAANVERAKVLEGEIADIRKRYDLKLDKGSKEATALKSKLSQKETELKEIAPKPAVTTPQAPLEKPGISQAPQMVGQVPVTTGAKPEAKAPVSTPTVEAKGKVPAAGKKVVEAKKEEKKPAAPEDLQTLLKKTDFWYDLPDYIFETIPEMGDILLKAVNQGWTADKFLSTAKQTNWWRSNSAAFRERIIQKGEYEDLRSRGLDTKNTIYGNWLDKQIKSVKAQAKNVAGVTLDDAQAQQVAEKIWQGNLDGDSSAINKLIAPFIGKVTDIYAKSPVTSYGGQALQNYQTLQAIAKANGLTLKDVLPQISATAAGGDLEKAVLQGLATGDIDINQINQNARQIAAQGQPEYVRNLLNQGYDLEQIYAPYKQVMSNVLEIMPDQIDVNDPTLRSAINNNGDMNVYDFKKALRKDSRWQYTEGANKEMTGLAQDLLRNFGFQG